MYFHNGIDEGDIILSPAEFENTFGFKAKAHTNYILHLNSYRVEDEEPTQRGSDNQRDTPKKNGNEQK